MAWHTVSPPGLPAQSACVHGACLLVLTLYSLFLCQSLLTKVEFQGDRDRIRLFSVTQALALA